MFEKWKRAAEAFPRIDIITRWEKKDQGFYAPGALIQVTNGRNMLYQCFSEEPGEATYCTLMFGDKPLFQFQGNEYYCPTCEKIVRSGYQLEQTEEFRRDKLNSENPAFADALDALIPLLGLLNNNYYVILDTELYPTDGNGHLFWNVPNSDVCVPGSCLFYRGDGEWGFLRPHFTVATQAVEKLQESRVEYYRAHPGCRAVAYYMDGYMAALIDGHHKAMAAAVEHRKVKALVIMPCYAVKCRENGGSIKAYIAAGDMRFACEKYGLKEASGDFVKRISFDEIMQVREWIPAAERELPYDEEALAAYYPNAEEMADIDACGDISEKKLDRILSEDCICTPKEIQILMKGLGGLRHERLFELADFFLEKCSYISLLRFHDADLFMGIVEQLVKLPHSAELEEYMINLMVEYEDEYPSAAERIADWL